MKKNKILEYGGYLLGIVMLLAFIVPDLFLPAGITGAFALAIFTQSCGENVSGAAKIFIAEKSVATAFTVTTGEISEVTGTTPFMRVDALQDSVSWVQAEEIVGLNNAKFTNTVEFDIMPPATATNTFLNALIDASPCGLFALIVDGNGSCWIVGYNSTDIRERPLKLQGINHPTGKGLSEAEGNTVRITLGNECGGIALPLDSTLTAAVVTTGDASICKWS